MLQTRNSKGTIMLKTHGLLVLLPNKSSYEFALVIVCCGLLVCKGQSPYDGAGCGFPGEPLEGSVTPNRSNYLTRDTVTYECVADYTLVGPHQITCRQDNTWTSDPPICLKEAAEFGRSTVADGNVNTCNDVTNQIPLSLKTIPFSLHSISAVIFSFSKVSGTPSVDVHISNRGENPQLCATIVNVPRQDSNVYHRYDCNKSLAGNTIKVTTRSASPFSPTVSVTICEIGITSETNGGSQSKCGRPPIPFHGRIKHMTEDRVTYECDKGFYVRTSATSICEDRVWKNHVQCIRMNLTCGHPGCPANGYYESVDSKAGTISYACLPGHFLVGPSYRSCLPNGTWSNWNQMAKCVPNVAYDKDIVHSDGSKGMNKPSVDGNVETCDVIGYNRNDNTQQRWWKIDFKTLQRISNIRIIQPKGQLKTLKASALYNSATMVEIPCKQEPDQSLRCQPQTPVNVMAIYIQPEVARTNFTLCEVIVTDLIGVIPCGTIDEPLNGKVVYEREKPRIVCESGYNVIGTSEVSSCIGGQWQWKGHGSAAVCIPVGTGTTRPFVNPNQSTTYRPNPTKGTSGSISTQEHSEVEKDTMLIGVIGIAVGVTAASVSILISIVVIVCIMKRHYKKKHECSHDNCTRQNSNHTHSYVSGSGGSRTGRDWDESSIHLYETVKPEYDTLEGPYAQTLVVNESYVLTTPKNTINWTRPRLAPPRNNHIYDVVSTDDPLAQNVLLNGHTDPRGETTVPRTSL